MENVKSKMKPSKKTINPVPEQRDYKEAKRLNDSEPFQKSFQEDMRGAMEGEEEVPDKK